VITRAAGRIGQAVRAALADRWDLVSTDVEPADGVTSLDVTDGAACREARALGYQPVDGAWGHPLINPAITRSSTTLGRQSL
jgi:hypothetical protein